MPVLHINTFTQDTPKEAALKPLEEAAEVYGAWQRLEKTRTPWPSVKAYTELGEEIADCVTACANLAARYGIDLDAALAQVEEKNRTRGRY